MAMFSIPIRVLWRFCSRGEQGCGCACAQKRLGADRLVVFGDSHNDMAMMSVADTAVAMANATADVKAMATVITGRNTESSVARFIEADK